MFSSNNNNQMTFTNDRDLDKSKKHLQPAKHNNNTLSRSSFCNDNGNDNGNIFLLCSHSGCNTKYKLNNFSPLTPVTAPMNEDEKFWAILESITQTKLFCMQHSLHHATTICANSKIVYEE